MPLTMISSHSLSQAKHTPNAPSTPGDCGILSILLFFVGLKKKEDIRCGMEDVWVEVGRCDGVVVVFFRQRRWS
jgi:hypothetical protein